MLYIYIEIKFLTTYITCTILVDELRRLSNQEAFTDELLIKYNVPHVHVSYEKLYYPNEAKAATTTEGAVVSVPTPASVDTAAAAAATEWMKIFQFLGVGPTSNLTMSDIQNAMGYVPTTTSRYHYDILSPENFRQVANVLRGTEFEHLLGSSNTATAAMAVGDTSTTAKRSFSTPTSSGAITLNGSATRTTSTSTTTATTSTLDYSKILDVNTPTRSYSTTAEEEKNGGGICFYGSIRFFIDNSKIKKEEDRRSKEYADAMFNSLRDIALRSFNDAMIANDTIKVLAPIVVSNSLNEDDNTDNNNIPTAEEYRAVLEPIVDASYPKVQLDVSEDAYETAAKQFESSTTCKWIAVVKLDADDALMPGY